MRFRFLGECCAVGLRKAIAPSACFLSASALDRSRENTALDMLCNLYRRRRIRVVVLLLLAAICQLILALGPARVRADSSPDVAPAPAVRASPPDSQIMHFNLLGPDWAKIPESYSGISPMRVVAELNIPKEYVFRNSLRKPLTENESSIPIVVLYPSMKGGADEGRSSAARIYAVIDAGEENRSRKGVQSLLGRPGMKVDPRLNIDGLCGYIDNEHAGAAGQLFYSSCNPTEQTFFVACFPPFRGRRSCSDTTFLEGEIGAELTYQYSLLKEHRMMLDALRRLVTSFTER